MNRITLLAGLLLATITSDAQNYYNFAKSTDTYTDLTTSTNMNGNVPWMYEDFGPISSAFPIYVFGETFSSFGFEDDNFVLVKTLPAGEEYVYIAPISGYFQDRNTTGTGASQSPISYKVDGTSGSRILKLELKNAGLEVEYDNNATTNLYTNYQIWFYEADKSIEFRFGPNNVTNIATLNDEGTYWSIFLYEATNGDKAGAVTGNTNTPSYGEYNDPSQITTNLNSLPAANTVYRFAVNPLAVKDQEKIEFSMFPNPATNLLNLTFTNTVNKPYSVYDLMGREVLKGFLNNASEAQINVGSLQNGSYILRIAGSTQKFIKN